MKKNQILTLLASMLSSLAFFFTIQSGCVPWLSREAKMPESMLEAEE
ncbi:hypothetical protein SAMN05446037_101366 [Anaerovirgula multivorans]|uniref:Cyclic lactone autoinducer peptide n=1 Tax=Anaerovirgula multivorans TaxID=312168 RepID=A0A239FLE6_9FIRM|nr:hypothetical protein [Anaerovirgula multivorans]SNS57428.1 hypothetical protein SAMN05446037_101366 [Anaerovirgula multivorans]